MRIARNAAVAVLALLAIGIVLPVAWSAVFGNNDLCACSLSSEPQVIQSAMDVLMTDKGITQVEPSVYAVQDWTSYPIARGVGSLPLSDYLKEATTNYYYCWDTAGSITQQEESGLVRCSQQ